MSSASPPEIGFILTPAPVHDQHPNPNLCVSGIPVSPIPISPIRPISSPIQFDIEKPLTSVSEFEDKENDYEVEEEDAFIHHENKKRFCSTPSPHRCHPVGNDGMRHNLLVQRTFNSHEGPLTSSPLRKVPFISTPGLCTPNSSAVPRSAGKETNSGGSYSVSTHQNIFKTPVRGQHNNPDRDYHLCDRTPSDPRTPAGFMSPASSLYAFTPGRQFVNPFEQDHERLHMPMLTPSVFQVKKNEVESSAESEGFWTVDQRALMMPVDIKESEILRQHYHQTKRDKEMDPLFQHAVDRFFAQKLIAPSPWSEKSTGSAGRLVHTPTGVKSSAVAKSVSCQTVMSVPPDVDLMAKIGDEYRLPDSDQLVHVSPVDSSFAGGFIRRKLLHQLNENDNESAIVGASPILPSRTLNDEDRAAQTTTCQMSPSKQVTPELTKQTPCKKSSTGHFSSSPIRSNGDKGHYPAMSESDLLASPELSPIAGQGGNKPLRSSDVFTPRQEFERSREIMQLDFSSILDEPDDFDNANLSEKTGTLIQTKSRYSGSLQGHSGPLHTTSTYVNSQEPPPNNTQSMTSNLSLSGIGNCEEAMAASRLNNNNNNNSSDIISNKFTSILKKSLLTSALSAESTQEIPTNVPNFLSSQDTGYQTASLQSITNINSASNPNQMQDMYSSSLLSSSSSANQSLTAAKSKTVPSSCAFMDYSSNINPSSDNNSNKGIGNSLHMSLTNFTHQCAGIVPYNNISKSEMCMGDEGNSLDSYLKSGARLSYFDNDDNINNVDDFYSNSFSKGHNNCRIRKIRTMSDVRRHREKSSASRDLTSSFNDEAKSASTIVVRLSRSLSNPSVNTDKPTTSGPPDMISAATVPVLHETKSVLNTPDAKPFLLEEHNNVNCDIKENKCTDRVNNAVDGDGVMGSVAVSSASIEKRPFKNIGICTENTFEFGGIQNDDHEHLQKGNKFIKLLEDEQEHCVDDIKVSVACSVNNEFKASKFSLDDKNTLDEARVLLGKSEALRLHHDIEEDKDKLEMDTFYRYISENDRSTLSSGDVQFQKLLGAKYEVMDEVTHHHQHEKSNDENKAEFLPSQKIQHPVCMSTSHDSMFDSLEEKINSVEGVKLGSEIAAEILRRAGEDLAQFTPSVNGDATTGPQSTLS